MLGTVRRGRAAGATSGGVSSIPERGEIGVEQVLEVVGQLDEGEGEGASVRDVVWELEVEEHQVLDTWRRAAHDGLLLRAVLRKPGDAEARWRLTPGGWAALGERTRALAEGLAVRTRLARPVVGSLRSGAAAWGLRARDAGAETVRRRGRVGG